MQIHRFEKPLDSDCLLGQMIHPDVFQRLKRIQELPTMMVANFCGVERDDVGMWLVWQFVPGLSLDQWLGAEPDERSRETLARLLVSTVTHLHTLGIVHGELHERNIIVMPGGTPMITHLSPLLHDDPVVDARALDKIMQRLISIHGNGRDTIRHTGRLQDEVRDVARGAGRDRILAVLLLFGSLASSAAIFWYTQRR